MTRSALAAETSRLDAILPPYETKALGQPARAPAPHVVTPEAKAIVETIDAQGRQLDALSRRVALADIKANHETRMKRWDDLKSAIDTRDIEAKRRPTRGADPLHEETIRRTGAALDKTTDQAREIVDLKAKVLRLETKANRPAGLAPHRAQPVAPGAQKAANVELYRAAVLHHLKTGDQMYRGQSITDIQSKAMSTTVAADGGVLVIPEHDTGPVEKLLLQISPVRAFATVRNISTATLKIPHNVGGIASGWVGETAARPQTATPQLVERDFPSQELYAQPAATQTMLDDSSIDIEQFLADEVRDEFSAQESSAFIAGDGVGKPKGFIGGYTPVANSGWTDGNVGYIATGVAGDFPAVGGSDKLIDLAYALKAQDRAEGTFWANRGTISAVRKFKDTTGQYIWSPGSPVTGQPASLQGYELVEAEQMPAIGANSFAIAFANMRRCYTIVDRIGIRVIRDPYTAKPYILFYTTKRVGGAIRSFESVKLLKFAAA